MRTYDWLIADPQIMSTLAARRRTWLVTGAAGFIGSNLIEFLLRAGQHVRGLDNFATGHPRNLQEVRDSVGAEGWSRFEFVEADIRDKTACLAAAADIEHVLHQAALGSVPRSIDDPLTSNDVNISGFLSVLEAARLKGAASFVYAASSSTYGDEPSLPKREDRIGRPLSPYAVTKYVNELYAEVYQRCYSFQAVGLRYFNVFGPRQDPHGAYAAVIPKWISAMISDNEIVVNGDGETSRDFCFVDNAVQANVKASLVGGLDGVYNVAVGGQTSLNALFEQIRTILSLHQLHYSRVPVYGPFRAGDVRHSRASIEKASAAFGYAPTHDVQRGLSDAMPWYLNFFRPQQAKVSTLDA
jgi:UDP-N-acetylglucosamine/UDP-N-acetylgalactosamine 4-epimerase